MIDATRICACMGKLKGEPYCPCVMRQKGLDTSHHELTEEEKKMWESFLMKCVENEKEIKMTDKKMKGGAA